LYLLGSAPASAPHFVIGAIAAALTGDVSFASSALFPTLTTHQNLVECCALAPLQVLVESKALSAEVSALAGSGGPSLVVRARPGAPAIGSTDGAADALAPAAVSVIDFILTARGSDGSGATLAVAAPRVGTARPARARGARAAAAATLLALLSLLALLAFLSLLALLSFLSLLSLLALLSLLSFLVLLSLAFQSASADSEVFAQSRALAHNIVDHLDLAVTLESVVAHVEASPAGLGWHFFVHLPHGVLMVFHIAAKVPVFLLMRVQDEFLIIIVGPLLLDIGCLLGRLAPAGFFGADFGVGEDSVRAAEGATNILFYHEFVVPFAAVLHPIRISVADLSTFSTGAGAALGGASLPLAEFLRLFGGVGGGRGDGGFVRSLCSHASC